MQTSPFYRGWKLTYGDATGKQLALLVPASYRVVHFASAADEGTDWNVANPTHPTWYFHSETTPATDYIAVDHDGTDGTINIAGGNLKLAIAGTDIFEVTSTGIVLTDDELIGIGTGSAARFSWDTTDANANELLLQLPAGGATDVPVLVIGDTLESDDLGLFNGVVSTTLALMGSTATATGPSLNFRKSRGTNSSPTVVTSGDDMGSLDFYGAVAAGEYVRGARILAEMTGTVATTRGPGVLTFQTATDAAPSTLTTAMTIDAAQLVTLTAGLTVSAGAVDLSAATVTLPTRTAFIDLEDLVKGADGAALGIVTSTDDFFRDIGTDQWMLKGEPSVNETEGTTGLFAFVLPENYVSGGTITLRAVADVLVEGDAVLTSATVDFEARLVSMVDGSIGADLVTTAATAITATASTADFVVTPTSLVAGDKLSCKMVTSVVEEAGGTGAATALIYKMGAVVQVNK